MKLFLVRHGIALDGLNAEVKTDAQRPLTAEGIEETELVAKGLKRMGVRLDLLVSSPLVRARQTAEIFSDVFKMEKPTEICDALSPGVDTPQLFRFLKAQKGEAIALFGHEPDMGELVQILLGAEFHVPFKKAGVCRIDLFDMPPSSPGVLKWFMPPKISRLLGK